MPRIHKHTRSDNLTPNDNLERFYIGHIEFLRRELRRAEIFFRENGITGKDLETKLSNLKTIIEERDCFREWIRQLQYTQSIASRMINEINAEKRLLQQENAQLRRDLEYEQATNGRIINNLRNQVDILENQENIFTEILRNQGQVISRLHRQDAFIYEVEEDFETSD
ncbi:2134_t:CDS:2 [Dentiscutata heterogama]|uniref:2134_t:CDS:1 n=1 Tax=Dentiscutata heterogama TaxID=1316150 RepID=A0ACA9LPR9_9GLOM|nr:2134_t:CDS:2 [Dentiscutata heterogama]